MSPHTSRAELDEDARYIAMLLSDPSVEVFPTGEYGCEFKVRASSRLKRHDIRSFAHVAHGTKVGSFQQRRKLRM